MVEVVAELAGSKTREEVKGPWAATTVPATRRKRRESLVGIVGGEEEKERQWGQWRDDICWEENAAAKDKSRT